MTPTVSTDRQAPLSFLLVEDDDDHAQLMMHALKRGRHPLTVRPVADDAFGPSRQTTGLNPGRARTRRASPLGRRATSRIISRPDSRRSSIPSAARWWRSSATWRACDRKTARL